MLNRGTKKSRDIFFVIVLPFIAFPFICLFLYIFTTLSSRFYVAAILIYLVLLQSALITIALSYIGIYLRNEAIKKPWKELATTLNLEVVPGDFFSSGMSLKGKYQAYHLTLETIRKEAMYTQITLEANDTNLLDQPPTSNNDLLFKNKFDFNIILNRLNPGYAMQGTFEIDPMGQCIHYKQLDIEQDKENLVYLFDKMVSLQEIYRQGLNVGAKSILPLRQIALDQDHRLNFMAKQLIYDIALNTKNQFAAHLSEIWCYDCLTHYGVHTVKLTEISNVTYYACRTCLGSRNFFKGKVIVVLHNQLPEEQVKDQNTLRIKWVPTQAIFDFDAIEIIQATDEEVERFVMKVGNDTDPIRQSRYKKMACVISPECNLSENAYRILAETFGAVKDVK